MPQGRRGRMAMSSHAGRIERRSAHPTDGGEKAEEPELPQAPARGSDDVLRSMSVRLARAGLGRHPTSRGASSRASAPRPGGERSPTRRLQTAAVGGQVLDPIPRLWDGSASRPLGGSRCAPRPRPLTVDLATVDHMLMRKSLSSVSELTARRAGSRAGFTQRDPRIDALMDSYVEWREECETVETGYEQWTQSERCDRRLAYAAYRAALDREEKAAAVYRLAATRLVSAAREQRQS